MKDIEFLYDDFNLEKEKLEEIAKTATKRPEPKKDFNSLILRRFTKALLMAAARQYKKLEIKKAVPELKKPAVVPIKQKVLQKIEQKVEVKKSGLKKIEQKVEIPKPEFLQRETEYPLVVTLDTNKLLVKAVVKNHEYFLEEPVLTNLELFVVNRLKDKLVNKIMRKPELANNKEFLLKIIQKYCNKFKVPFNMDNYDRIRYFLIRDILGFGKIDALLKDKNIHEIKCDVVNKPVLIKYNEIENMETNVIFEDKDKLEKLIKKLFAMAKQKIRSGVNYLDTDLTGLKVKAMLDSEEENLSFDIKKY